MSKYEGLNMSSEDIKTPEQETFAEQLEKMAQQTPSVEARDLRRKKPSKLKGAGYALALAASLLGFGSGAGAGEVSSPDNNPNVAQKAENQTESKSEIAKSEFEKTKENIKDYIGNETGAIDLGSEGALVFIVKEKSNKPKIEAVKIPLDGCKKLNHDLDGNLTYTLATGEGRLQRGISRENYFAEKVHDVDTKMSKSQVEKAEKEWKEVNKENKGGIKQNTFFMKDGEKGYIVGRYFKKNGDPTYHMTAEEGLDKHFQHEELGSEKSRQVQTHDSFEAKRSAILELESLGRTCDWDYTKLEDVKKEEPKKINANLVKLWNNDEPPLIDRYVTRYEHTDADGKKESRYIEFSENLDMPDAED